MKSLIINNKKTQSIDPQLQILRENQFEATICDDWDKALQLCKESFFPIILIYTVSPKEQELHFCQAVATLRHNHRHVILFITEELQEEDYPKLVNAGANDLLFEPIDTDILNMWCRFARRKLSNPLENKILESGLNQAEEKYRQFFNHLSLGFYQSTPQGEFLLINPALASILGYESPQQMMEEITDIGSQFYADPERKKEFELLMDREGKVVEFRSPVYCRDQSTVWITQNVNSVKDNKGNVIRYEGMVVDITQYLQTEKDLQKSNKDLKDASQQLDMNELQLSISYSEMERINRVFKKFVPSQFINRIYSEQTALSGQFDEENLSILFGDIRGYTKLSERMSPVENFEFLNAVFAMVEPAVSEHAGFVDKFIGDAIMALFEGETSHDNAIHAAIAIQEAIKRYNEKRREEKKEEIRFGIGVNTGPVMVGVLGSPARLNSTVIGDHVNLGARIEQLTKKYQAQILISNYTYDSINAKQFMIREIDTVFVRGRRAPVMIFEVFDSNEPSIKRKKMATSELLYQGIVSFKCQFFKEALECFRKCNEIFPEDPVAKEYLNRCEYYQSYPPQDLFWDGIT